MKDLSKLHDLGGKVAIVTGAATGIGRETAETLAAAGARVAGGDVNTDAMAGHDFLAHAAWLDVSDAASVKAFYAGVTEALGGVDILVNSAGIFPFADFEGMGVEMWDKVQAVNTRGTFLMCQAALSAMRARGGGAIVNISSSNSLRAVVRNNVHYAASKAGVNAITVSLALEAAPDSIRVNAILPGGIATEQAAKAPEGWEMSGPIMQPGRIPLTGTSGAPAEIAKAVLFFASDASAYVTGQLLWVDGGFSVS